MNYKHDLKDIDCAIKSKNKIILNIKVLELNLNMTFDLVGEMSPYFIIQHNKIKYRTKTIKDGGRFAKWDSNDPPFQLKDVENRDEILISGYDSDLLYDDFMGSNTLKVQQIVNFKYSDQWVDLFYNNSKSGRVKIYFKLNSEIEMEARKSRIII